MKFWRKKPHPTLPAFHPNTVIRDWGDGHAFRIADAQTGTIVFGATGSGKTSGVAKHLAYGYLAGGFGGLVLCAKGDECQQWQKWAAECGREEDLIIINADGDWRYNFMEDEASRPGSGGGYAINVVALLDEVAGAIAGSGKGEGGGDSKFWEDALHNLNSNLVDLPLLAGLPVSLPLLRDIASSAAQSVEQVKDPAWQQESACARILKEADEATKGGDPEVRADFEECRTYWTADFPALAQQTRSSILLNFSILIRPLVTRPLRKLFSSDINVRPEDAFSGKILVVSLAVQEYRLAGRIANLIWKYCFQCAILRRVQPADRQSFLRPAFIWGDESQLFVSKFDAEFQAVARSSGGCSVYLTQNYAGLRRALKSDDAVDSLLGNLVNKFFCQNAGETNAWASNILGERWVTVTSTNAGQSNNDNPLGDGTPRQTAGISRNEQHRSYVEPSVFTTLKRGGPQNNFLVEAIVYEGGSLFANGNEMLPYKLLTFSQK